MVMKVAALITDAFTLFFILFGRKRGHFQQLTLLLLKFSVLYVDDIVEWKIYSMTLAPFEYLQYIEGTRIIEYIF